MKKNFLTLLKDNNIEPYELVKKLDVSITQLYKWNSEGISEKNKYYPILKKLIPELEPSKSTKGKRNNCGKKKRTQLELYATDVKAPKGEHTRPSEFPRVRFRKKEKE